MNKIVGKESLSDKVVKFEIEAPLIAKSRKPGHFVIVRVGKKENAFLTQLQLPILKKEQSLWLSNV
jgi:NAD(P)H-flavin reductase